MKQVVIGDIHNRTAKARQLFQEIGLVNGDDERQPGFKVIQLGDALSLGYDEQEVECYTYLQDKIDIWLLGNHELASLWYNDSHKHLGWDADSWHGWHVGRDREAESMVSTSLHALLASG
jgi:hypothetical protein